MTYIVLDLEWNQPPVNCRPYYCPFALVGEIIEIGAVKLNDDFTPAGTYKTYIKPSFYSKMQPYVKKITKITEETLRGAPDFETAIGEFFAFCGDDCAFLTWGPDDLPMLCDNFLAHGMKTDIIPPSYNLQQFFTAQLDVEDKQWALSDACDLLGIEKQMPEHDALADAFHTALICSKLDMKRGIADYPRETKPRRHYEHIDSIRKKALFPRKVAEDFVAGGFATRSEAIHSDEISLIPCPVCDLPMDYDMFVRQTPDKKVALCSCRDHKKFFIRLKLTKEEDGTYTATRMIYPGTPRLREYYNRIEANALSRRANK